MLSDYQRDTARYDGGKDIANRKRFVAQVLTGLRTLLADAEKTHACAMTGLLDESELAMLRKASGVVAKVVASMERDVTTARAIKDDYDKRKVAAHIALSAAFQAASVADVVALGQMTYNTPRHLVEDATEYGWKATRNTLMRDVLESLAQDCARKKENPAEFIAKINASRAIEGDQDDDIVRQLTMLAVAQQMEKAA